MPFLIFSLTETKEKFLPALSSHTGEPCLLLSGNCKARLYQRITWRFRHITPLFNLKISDWLSLSPNRVTYTGTAIPHCASIMPNQTESAGSHSRKMLSLKFRCRSISLPLVAIPVGTILCSIPSRATMLSIAGTSSHEMGFCHPLIPMQAWTDKKAKIKSGVCVSYKIVLAFSSLQLS